jgi:hypothetical protein
VFARQPHGSARLGGKRILARIPDAGFLEGARPAVVDPLQAVDV